MINFTKSALINISFPLSFLFIAKTGYSGFQPLAAGDSLPVTIIQLRSPALPDTSAHFTLRNEHSSLARKWLRGEMFIGPEEVGCMSVLAVLPSYKTHWEKGFLRSALQHLGNAFSMPPVWDHDPWNTNYINHPYAGAFYYNSIRSQGATRWQSFIYAVVQSTLWEFVVEGIAERPSIQDLLVTPIIGSLAGELTNRATIRMRKNGFSFIEKVVVFIINPMYVINNGYRSHNLPVH